MYIYSPLKSIRDIVFIFDYIYCIYIDFREIFKINIVIHLRFTIILLWNKSSLLYNVLYSTLYKSLYNVHSQNSNHSQTVQRTQIGLGKKNTSVWYQSFLKNMDYYRHLIVNISFRKPDYLCVLRGRFAVTQKCIVRPWGKSRVNAYMHSSSKKS